MRAEIGSNFWDTDTSRERRVRFWWEQKPYNRQFYKSGRNAIRMLCQILTKPGPKRILFPAYHCHTETECWYENGWQVHYYPVSMNFTVDAGKFQEAIDQCQPDVLFLQSFYGTDAYDDAGIQVIRSCKEGGCIIIEDITHSVYTEARTYEADYYVASLRKFFAIPEGGVLISAMPLPKKGKQPGDPRLVSCAREAFQLKTEYFNTMEPATKQAFRSKYVELNELISLEDGIYDMNPESLEILYTIDIKQVQSERQRNLRYLYDRMQGLAKLELRMSLPSAEAVPLYLPVYARDTKARDALRAELAGKDIYCPVLWPQSERLTALDSETMNIYSRILCIPIDQRYDLSDMERIYKELRRWDEIV